MYRSDYIVAFKATLDKLMEITTKKNSDYTGDSDDVFSNFKLVEQIGIASAEVGILTRMTDKMSRIGGLLKKGSQQVKDESIQDTLSDLAVYSIILSIYLSQKKD